MKFSLFYFPSLGGGDPLSYERKNIGKDPRFFEYLLDVIREHAIMAEEAGFHGVYFAEHHFDTEGFEACGNPLLLDNWVGHAHEEDPHRDDGPRSAMLASVAGGRGHRDHDPHVG